MTAAQALSVTDDEQRTLTLPGPAQRIVSLSPGITAMLFAAGAGARIVGTSAYSDEPAAAQRIEHVGDSQSFDLERILALHPDVVAVWSGGTPEAQIARLQRAGLAVYREHLRRLEDVPASLERLGALTGTEARAGAAAAALAARIQALRARYANAVRDSVLLQLWDQPIYTVGHDELISDVLRACGERNVFDDLSAAGPAVSLESVLARDPDVIVVLADSDGAGRAWQDAWQRYPSLRAVRSGRVMRWVDARLARLGPSIVDGAEDLCRALRAARPHS